MMSAFFPSEKVIWNQFKALGRTFPEIIMGLKKDIHLHNRQRFPAELNLCDQSVKRLFMEVTPQPILPMVRRKGMKELFRCQNLSRRYDDRERKHSGTHRGE
eukprot:GHVP01041742.1.p1 GENE.GHVP01041742.1~~GHVP01041742.1.p1  ORF type:complete len:102 (-),score=7.16 GHVP01041742.1:203-508(-)